jgi:hypothetical protein
LKGRGLGISDSSQENYRNLMTFRGAVRALSENPELPKHRLGLKFFEPDLDPLIGGFGTKDSMGIDYYIFAIKEILVILDELLTEDVSLAVHAYAEKIFVPPAQEHKKSIND